MMTIVKKKIAGKTLGYVLGYWHSSPRWSFWDDEKINKEETFHSFRSGVVFPTLEAAKVYRSDMERRRTESGVEYETIFDDDDDDEFPLD